MISNDPNYTGWELYTPPGHAPRAYYFIGGRVWGIIHELTPTCYMAVYRVPVRNDDITLGRYPQLQMAKIAITTHIGIGLLDGSIDPGHIVDR